jgi:ubiquinone/menaquinone biosynthesis C-methylase UbiE
MFTGHDVSMNPHPRHDEIDEAARFDRLARWYDFCIKPAEWLISRHRRELLAKAHGEVLEVGVGTGKTLHLYPPHCRLTGIDPSQKMIERARQKAAKLGLDVTLREMAAEALDFPASTFDTCAASLTFCSVADPRLALGEIHRVVRPGGQLLMVEHIRPRGRLGSLSDRLDPWYYRQSCHINRRTPEYVREAGFEVVLEERWLWGVFAAVQAFRR